MSSSLTLGLVSLGPLPGTLSVIRLAPHSRLPGRGPLAMAAQARQESAPPATAAQASHVMIEFPGFFCVITLLVFESIVFTCLSVLLSPLECKFPMGETSRSPSMSADSPMAPVPTSTLRLVSTPTSAVRLSVPPYLRVYLSIAGLTPARSADKAQKLRACRLGRQMRNTFAFWQHDYLCRTF